MKWQKMINMKNMKMMKSDKLIKLKKSISVTAKHQKT